MGLLAFADDIVMLANGHEQAQTMINTLEIILGRYSLELNIAKTKYIASDEGQLSCKGEPI